MVACGLREREGKVRVVGDTVLLTYGGLWSAREGGEGKSSGDTLLLTYGGLWSARGRREGDSSGRKQDICGGIRDNNREATDLVGNNR